MTDDPHSPSPRAMPPLGPPYVSSADRPPPPNFPPSPPEQWLAPPPLLPSPIATPPSRWTDERKRRALVGAAVATALAVILGVVIGSSANQDPTPTAAPFPTTTTAEPSFAGPSSTEGSSASSSAVPTPTTAPQDVNAVILEIEQFVERERGLKYKQQVAVHLATESEFQAQLFKNFDKERASLIEEGQVLTATRLLPDGSDVVADERSLLSIGVVGFYDPESKELFVRGTATTPYVRQVLAHELTHALDDQWFDLNRPQLDNADDETGFAFSALAEGNARRIENAYLASLSPADQTAAMDEEQQLVAQHPEVFSLPPILIALMQAPYDEGPSFVNALLRAGSQQRLDAAFTNAPTTSEQIINPQKFLAGEGAVPLPTPTADGPAANQGVLGALLLREMLFDSLGSGNQVNRAIDGWGGDRYVTWINGTGVCLRDTFVGDSPAETAQLVSALTTWAGDHNGSVDAPASGPATLTVCN
ncbi:MAG TPA: hypothetical protein VGZ52_07020 [Acidimicrobiales bacterium]|jgi:hypothetical protein|nr:hypothetical protein [Acidimicrobiales bacterium]